MQKNQALVLSFEGRLWIGNEDASWDEDFLQREKIGLILNLTQNYPPFFRKFSSTDYFQEIGLLLDQKRDNFEDLLKYTMKIIDVHLRKKINLLVHSQDDRSAVVIRAYLIKYRKMEPKKVFRQIPREIFKQITNVA